MLVAVQLLQDAIHGPGPSSFSLYHPQCIAFHQQASCSCWQRVCCISRYYTHAQPHSIILQRKRKLLHHLIYYHHHQMTFLPLGQNCVTGPHHTVRKVFYPLWWKVIQDKPSATSTNHLINIFYGLCVRIRMFGLL